MRTQRVLVLMVLLTMVLLMGNLPAPYYACEGKKVGDMNDPSNIVARTTENCLDLREIEHKFKGNYTYVVTAINRYKHESTPTFGVTRRM